MMGRVGPEVSRGINRRSLIKRAAIVGGAAWVTPVIIGSVASPAGAVTVQPGCFVMYSSAGSGSTSAAGQWTAWQTTQPGPPGSTGGTGPLCPPTGGCTPTTSAAALAVLNLPTPNVVDGAFNVPVTVSVKGGYSCRIVAASATVTTSAGNDADACPEARGRREPDDVRCAPSSVSRDQSDRPACFGQPR